tara:strand:+ start:1347 stop:1661 length:315 start_codon:yes stop_codon:yes gene_type:complete
MSKKKLNENTPGYKNRAFGAPLPTLASIQKEFQAKQAAKQVKEEAKPLKEQYIEGMYDLDDGLALIKDAWMGWRKGIETQASDIKPAQKELLNYIAKWLKKNIR